MTLITEGRYTGDFLASEASGARSRDEIVVNQGQNLGVGTVLGRISTGAAAPAPGGDNVGNGVMGTITVGHNALAGNYLLEITAEASNAGEFTLHDPKGNLVGTGNVASAFTSTHLSFTLADGSEDFDEGDTFVIAVTTVPGQYVAYAPNASNGSQTAIGILWEDTNATDEAQRAVAITRDAEVKADLLVWPTGFTPAQIATGTTQLEARGIIARAGY